ncbi:MAG TPA: helix-hairpin-helix domain-containing protein [Candidatus Binatia bacterium]|nr:helix-hairpin-helix domain-containing protein [Candidatus Binatia bacterium]
MAPAPSPASPPANRGSVRDPGGSGAPVTISNRDVVRTLERIAGLLEIRGDNPFKVRAYRQAAVQVENLETPLPEIAAQEGGLRAIEGFGAAIAEKVQELLRTGRLGFLEDLEGEVPPTLLTICELPGVGPRTAAALWHEAGISTIDQLDHAARSGGLAGIPRLGARSLENLVAALDRRVARGGRRRRPREEVTGLAETLRDELRALPAAQRVELAGSYRRGEATVGDLDIVVATRHPVEVLTCFAALPQVERVILRGDTKCSIEAGGGLQVDCRAIPPESFGAAWQYFTGSAAHNVRLRGRALRLGLTLNEYGVYRVEGGGRVAGAEEAEVYAALGLDWIPPERRLDRGEIDAASRGVSAPMAGE